MKEQNTGAMIYTQEDVDELKATFSRIRQKSNNRRLALKQLHKAHQLTIEWTKNIVRSNEKLCAEAQELKQEVEELRKELHNRPYQEAKRHWWSMA